jgi:hypothetical protein
MDNESIKQLIDNQNEIKDSLKKIAKSVAFIFQLLVVALIIGILGLLG